MDNDDLKRKLDSVGKRIFVEYFHLFKQYASGMLTREQIIFNLVGENVSNDSGAAIRVGNAKKIFDDSKELDALGTIVQSTRLPDTVIQKAKELINNEADHYNDQSKCCQ
jgi:hypothetical protein